MSGGNKNSPRPDSKGANHILSQDATHRAVEGCYSLLTAVCRVSFMWLAVQSYAKGARLAIYHSQNNQIIIE